MRIILRRVMIRGDADWLRTSDTKIYLNAADVKATLLDSRGSRFRL
jgi:hypothetical protein